MDTAWIVPMLALCTLGAVCIFALISKERTEERKHDPFAPKSTLAKDGPQGGVAFLLPLDQRVNRNPNVEPVLE
ncbi:hypothetical protein [Cypionkella sinensis]|uniref:Uncharacterized protein n=1 Tax=Cypionkella sinensis TaxID=1756043 RepID=A0ABV7J453_9RHOB